MLTATIWDVSSLKLVTCSKSFLIGGGRGEARILEPPLPLSNFCGKFAQFVSFTSAIIAFSDFFIYFLFDSAILASFLFYI